MSGKKDEQNVSDSQSCETRRLYEMSKFYFNNHWAEIAIDMFLLQPIHVDLKTY